MTPRICCPADEIRKHEEITGAAMLNGATKKAVATERAPPELATHLRLNAARYNTNSQMIRQVLSCVNLKLLSQPTTMWTDHVLSKAKKEVREDSARQMTEQRQRERKDK